MTRIICCSLYCLFAVCGLVIAYHLGCRPPSTTTYRGDLLLNDNNEIVDPATGKVIGIVGEGGDILIYD